jgi:hypothetical protein
MTRPHPLAARVLVPWLLLALGVALASILPAQAQTAGLVVRIEGLPANGVAGIVRRGDRQIDLRIGQPLRVGDLVEITYPVEAIVVDVGTADRVRLERAGNPHDIRQSMNLGSQQQALLNMLTAPRPPPPVTVVSTGSRGGGEPAPASPLEATAQHVARDARSLPIAWTGGTAPFTVSVTAESGALGSIETAERFVVVPLNAPIPASARLIVRDAGGREVRIALAGGTIALPATVSATRVDSPALMALIAATAIAEAGPGHRLEAARRAQEVVQDTPAAALFRDQWLGVAAGP